MQEVLKQLQKEIEAQRERVNYYEIARDKTARGSARWRELDEIAERYKCKILGIEIAIEAIEKIRRDKMNEERILDRLEELNAYIQNFPNSELAPIIQKEIDYLKSLL